MKNIKFNRFFNNLFLINFLIFFLIFFFNFQNNILFQSKLFAQNIENKKQNNSNKSNFCNFSFKIFDKNQKPVSYASIGFLFDKKIIFAGLTDEKGEVLGENIAFGTYTLKINHVDFRDFTKENIIFDKEIIILENVILEENENIEAVEIIAKKPIIERFPDKVVMNVENSMLSTGSNAQALFQRLPAVTLTQEGQISLKGREGVTVMVDDRPIYVSGRDLKNFLKNLPSAQIASIEVISNPSAKYDAQGTAGIINIKLKKGAKLEGWQANINASYGQGIYEKLNAGGDVNITNKKFNLFVGYGYDYPNNFEKMQGNRGFGEQNNVLSSFQQTGYFPMLYQNHNLKTNLDIYLHPKHTLSLGVKGSLTSGYYKGGTNTTIFNAQNIKDSTLYTDQDYDENWKDYTANITHTYQINEQGTNLTTNVDVFQYNQDTKQQFITDFTNAQGLNLAFKDISRGKIPVGLRVLTLKNDFSHNFTKNTKLEAGFKAIYMRTASDVIFFRNEISNQNTQILDLNRTNNFIYSENIHAGYVNFQTEFQKFKIQAGLRAENTKGQGEQHTINQIFVRDYLNFFPTFAIGREISSKNQLNITYSRRIERPNYQELNPFQYYLDPYSAWAGNPLLLPQFSHNFELSHTYNDFLTTEIGYNTTENVITYTILQDNFTRNTLYTQQNLAKLNQFTFGTTLQFEFWKWYSGQLYAGLYYKQLFNNNVSNNFVQSQWTYQINTTQTFKFGKNWGGELQFFYNSPELDGIARTLPNYALGLGIEKKVLNEKITLKANVTDLFYTNRFGIDARSGNINNDMLWQWDSRVVTFAISYRLGSGFLAKKEENKEENVKSGRKK